MMFISVDSIEQGDFHGRVAQECNPPVLVKTNSSYMLKEKQRQKIEMMTYVLRIDKLV